MCDGVGVFGWLFYSSSPTVYTMVFYSSNYHDQVSLRYVVCECTMTEWFIRY